MQTILIWTVFIISGAIIAREIYFHVLENRQHKFLLLMTFMLAMFSLWYLLYWDHNSLGYKDRVDKARRKQLQKQAETWTNRYE
jgi:hypothetical protein